MSEYIIKDDYGLIAKWKDRPQEVVRCRDCKYYEAAPEDSGDWCGYWTDRLYADVRGSGFCAWGERRQP